MKKFLKGFLIFLLSCAIIGVFIGYFISTLPLMTYSAKAFLFAVSNDQYEQAYNVMLTPDFKKRNDFASFKQHIVASELNKYKEVVWLRNETYPNQLGGIVIGRVFTTANKPIVVEFQFTLVQGKNPNDKQWLINNIRFPKEYENLEPALP